MINFCKRSIESVKELFIIKEMNHSLNMITNLLLEDWEHRMMWERISQQKYKVKYLKIKSIIISRRNN